MPVSLTMRRVAQASAILLLVSGCAVSKPAKINSATVALQTASSVEFPAIEKANDLRARWGSALQAAFAAKSVTVQQGAPFLADFALSVREAEGGLAAIPDSSKKVEWKSEPRSDRLLDRCKTQRLRGTLVVFRRTDGAIVYRGESEADGCAFGPTELQAMAQTLVGNAIN